MMRELGTKFELVCDIIDVMTASRTTWLRYCKRFRKLTHTCLKTSWRSHSAGIPPGAVFGVATFYSHFTLEPKGKYLIKVCDGTACHVKKSTDIIKTIQQELGLNESKKTSDDLLFTLETVACLGACGLAPVIVINDEVHGSMNPEKAKELLNKIKEEESKNA